MPQDDAAFRAEGNHIKLCAASHGRAPERVIPFKDWPFLAPHTASAAVAEILRALEEGTTGRDGLSLVTPHDEGADLHPDLVARLSDSDAAALGLPQATRLVLALRSSGLIHRPGFRITHDWTRTNGVPVRAPVRNGRLIAEGQEWRIPEPLHGALHWIDAVNAALDEADRHAALAGLKTAMEAAGGQRIRCDSIIGRMRLAYASAFSLALHDRPDGPDFDPVLFSRAQLGTSLDGQAPDQDADSLLPPALASGFLRRFRASDGRRRAFLLDDGSLLFMDPPLARALELVRQAQASTPDQRRAFAAAPQRHLAAAIAQSGHGNVAASDIPFIETRQFSERVASIDLWRKPVLPWIRPKPGTWLPDAFGLRIGDPPHAHTIAIRPDMVGQARAAAQAALDVRLPLFDWDGHGIPATRAAITALRNLEAVSQVLGSGPGDAGPPPEALRREYFLQVRDDPDTAEFAPLARFDGATTPPDAMPPALRTPAKAHQLAGLRWLASCWLTGRPGALLADEAGLGKTLQALAFLVWLREHQGSDLPALVIAPADLLTHWEAEIGRHFAADAMGRVVRAVAPVQDLADWADAGLVLTTYEQIRDHHTAFASQSFAAILYDEAQQLKDPASQTTRAAKTLNARFQLAITAAFGECRPVELSSIVGVIDRGLLVPDDQAELDNRLSAQEGGRPPIILRRTQADCADSLPARHVVMLPMPMPPAQAKAYEQIVMRGLVAKDIGDSERIRDVLQALGDVSLHPAQARDRDQPSVETGASARFAATVDLMRKIAAQGEKALIICEDQDVQAFLASELRRALAIAHPVQRIYDTMPATARQAAFAAFEQGGEGFDVLIASPDAAHAGAPLTTVNHIIQLSRWWSPTAEDRITSLVSHLGQTRDVTVYLPQAVHPAVAQNSFDLRVDELRQRQRQQGQSPFNIEAELAALFDLVVSEAAEIIDASSAPAQLAEPPPPPAPTGIRKILGLVRPRQPAPTPALPASPPAPAWPKRIVYEEGGLRDRTIFTGPIASDPVKELAIVDPYGAAGDRGRRMIADFAKMLIGDGRGVEPVRLVAFDAESVELQRNETSDIQFEHMLECWEKTFIGGPPLQFLQVSKRGNRKLHDREVRVTTRSGRTLIWDIGRGIAGVMTAHYQCTVVLTEE